MRGSPKHHFLNENGVLLEIEDPRSMILVNLLLTSKVLMSNANTAKQMIVHALGEGVVIVL